jgi:hypothetical protein
MTKADEIKIKQLIHKLGLKYKLSDEVIKNIIDSPYEFTYEKLREVVLDGVTTEEELDKLKTNFNYKGLGKLYVDYPSLLKREKQKNFINILNKKNGRNS